MKFFNQGAAGPEAPYLDVEYRETVCRNRSPGLFVTIGDSVSVVLDREQVEKLLSLFGPATPTAHPKWEE